ncbi:MAG: hypothetical protein EBX40_07330 [Gammaproteobacteria bacterium]|nr:hypothetical protein [Gammaproteobacteria bacterium]
MAGLAAIAVLVEAVLGVATAVVLIVVVAIVRYCASEGVGNITWTNILSTKGKKTKSTINNTIRINFSMI